MKKKIAFLLLVATIISIVALCFTSCGGMDTGKAKEHIISFLKKVKEDDFDGAKELLHPDFEGDIVKYFNDVENAFKVDFQSGITIVAYTNTYVALYESKFDGSGYQLTMDIEVSGKELEIMVTVVENDSGYGVYGIRIDD